MDQQVGDEAGKERSGTDGDEVGLGDGFERLGQRLNVWRHEKELANFTLAGGDASFAADALDIFELRFELDRRCCGWKNVASGEQNFGGEPDGLGKIASDRSQGGEK